MTPILLVAALSLAVAAVLTLAIVLLLALVAACTAAAAWVWTPVAAHRYERVLRDRYEKLPPSQAYGHRHAAPPLAPAGVETDWYWAAARDASAVAELPPTQPMPVIGSPR